MLANLLASIIVGVIAGVGVSLAGGPAWGCVATGVIVYFVMVTARA